MSRGRPCSVCNHIARKSIEDLLRQGHNFQIVSQSFNINSQAVRRHALNHMEVKPKRNELLARWRGGDPGEQWNSYTLLLNDEKIGLLYLSKNLRPASLDFLLRRPNAMSVAIT